jgi:hypothetical protein
VAIPSDALFEHLDENLLSQTEQIESSRLAEVIDSADGDITALSSADFERVKYIVNKGRGKGTTALAGERLPKRLSRHPKCDGTVEDHRPVALDVRELIRKHVFEQPVGSVFHLNIAFPWLRLMRLNSSSLDLELVTGRTVIVPLVWARCGVMGERMRLQCPLCARRVCALYHLHGRVACRHCSNLWYAAQRTSCYGRNALAKRKIRRRLSDHGQLWAVKVSPRPRRMWRRTYARHCAALARIERKLAR